MLDMINTVLIWEIVLSIILGAFIGTEREYHKGKVGIGIRTTAFVSLIGMLSTYFSMMFGVPYIMLLGLIAVAAYSVSIFWYRVKEQMHHVGLTTSATIIVAFFIGAMVAFSLFAEASVLSIAVFILLFSKRGIRKRIKHLTNDEIISALQFAIIAFVIYPFIPNTEYFMINFRSVLEVVIVVSLISFIGFIAMRRFGLKWGSLITGLCGGIFNSSAVVISMMHMYKKNKKALNLFVFASLLAFMAMILRNFFIGSIFSNNIAALDYMAKFIAIAMLYYAFVFYFFSRKLPKIKNKKIESKMPFAIKPAIYFGILFTIILFISKFGVNYFGAGALLPISFFGGLVSSSGIAAASALMFAGGSISAEMLTISIAIACIAAMIGDTLISYVFKAQKFGTKIAYFVIGLIILFAIVSLL